MRDTPIGRRDVLAATALGAASLLTPRRARATCAAPRVYIHLLTPHEAPVPPDGGIVLSMDPSAGSFARPGEPSPTSFFPGQQFPTGLALSRRGHQVALAAELMSPGLLRLVPEHPPAPGRWIVTGSATHLELLFGPNPDPAPPAPTVTRVELTTQQVHYRWSPPQSAQIATAVLSNVPTAGALLVVRYSPVGAIDTQRWVEPGATSVELWRSAIGGCSMRTPGESGPPRGGTRRALARWIDRVGRLSPEQSAIPIVRR